MTRPAVRRCARCHRVTSRPVLVHEVHAATGPGFNVYACPECADRYPPMTDVMDVLDPAEPPRRSPRLTLRVYTVDARGTVTGERSRVEIRTGAGVVPPPQTSAYPPCGCPRCRGPEPGAAHRN